MIEPRISCDLRPVVNGQDDGISLAVGEEKPKGSPVNIRRQHSGGRDSGSGETDGEADRLTDTM